MRGEQEAVPSIFQREVEKTVSSANFCESPRASRTKRTDVKSEVEHRNNAVNVHSMRDGLNPVLPYVFNSSTSWDEARQNRLLMEATLTAFWRRSTKTYHPIKA